MDVRAGAVGIMVSNSEVGISVSACIKTIVRVPSGAFPAMVTVPKRKPAPGWNPETVIELSSTPFSWNLRPVIPPRLFP